ncbi:MAG: DUF1800 domain-containing protein [Haliscomenobacter sp.]|nr:DUF1800 domain-containing protein [Haliscomenobacter sp.]
MNRRSTLSLLSGSGQRTNTTSSGPQFSAASSPVRPLQGGLEPYTGSWSAQQAAHLLRRATFGPTIELIRQSAEEGLSATLDRLFAEPPLPDKPLNLEYASDAAVPVGKTWVDAPFNNADNNILGYRNRSLRAWTFDQILKERINIREKLTLFWHNHFATSDINDPNFLYYHITLLRSYAWGNFRDLVKAMTIDPTMLRFLNGNVNTRTRVNENYARELLELFTIGKGPLAGPGDYTNYTETDVKEIAKALTGWRDNGYRTTNATVKAGAVFRPAQHDTTKKVLSHRFDYAEILNQNENEYKAVVDLIFKKAEVARFICRKLYRWFVYYQITDEVETQVIAPMAQLLFSSNYEIKPALRALLGSAHFFDALNVGPMIKNPLDFSWGLIKQTYTPLPAGQTQKYSLLFNLSRTINLQQMEYFNPPDVAGWKPFYQEPSFYRIWINATTLAARMTYTNRMAIEGTVIGGFRLRIDPLSMITHLQNRLDPNALILELSDLLLPQPLTEAQLADLKEVLLPGLPDYEWTIEYQQYLSKPSDTNLKNAVESKLRNLFQAILSMAEFYLS